MDSGWMLSMFFDDSLTKITPRAFSVLHYVQFGVDEMRFEFRETIWG